MDASNSESKIRIIKWSSLWLAFKNPSSRDATAFLLLPPAGFFRLMVKPELFLALAVMALLAKGFKVSVGIFFLCDSVPVAAVAVDVEALVERELEEDAAEEPKVREIFGIPEDMCT